VSSHVPTGVAWNPTVPHGSDVGEAAAGTQRSSDVTTSPWRWLVVAAFVLFASLNFLDRQLLAAVAPSVMAEFGLNNAGYGTLLSAFGLTYMLIAPFAGLLVDRLGIRSGALLAVGIWSIVGAGTGFASSFAALIGWRMALGVAEAGGIPCSSKASASYLPPREQGLGIAIQSIGFTAGSMAAPLAVAVIAPMYGWRGAFVVCGLAGLLWLPLFWAISRRVPGAAAAGPANRNGSIAGLLLDTRLLTILIANVLIMVIHSMWMNWTTVYLVREYGLTQTAANWYFAWIPPIFATLGGLFGAWWTLRATAHGMTPVQARLRAIYTFAPTLLLTAAVPLMPSPALASAGISVSFFCVMATLNNLHVIPMDLFGVGRAAFTSALLVSSYAAVQTVLSPVMGAIVDRFGFGALCMAVAALPCVAAALLWGVFGARQAAIVEA
jgi:ACS family hexuronate transporter-like MFS transporter